MSRASCRTGEFPYGVEMATNSQDESMGEELSALGMALVTAIF